VASFSHQTNNTLASWVSCQIIEHVRCSAVPSRANCSEKIAGSGIGNLNRKVAPFGVMSQTRHAKNVSSILNSPDVWSALSDGYRMDRSTIVNPRRIVPPSGPHVSAKFVPTLYLKTVTTVKASWTGGANAARSLRTIQRVRQLAGHP
jgi:hypothetical protein